MDQVHRPAPLRRVDTKQKLGSTSKRGGSLRQLNRPWDVAFDHDRQQVIVSDTDHHRLQLFSRANLKHLGALGVGKQGRQQLGRLNCPRGLSIQPFTHHLVACDTLNHRVVVFSLDTNGDDVLVMR